MIKPWLAPIRPAVFLLILLTLLTGLIYPLMITALAQWIFPWEANGSMIETQVGPVGSRWIGQPFSASHYLWGRPSATQPFPYNGESSTGSNSGPSNPDFLKQIKSRVQRLKQLNPQAPILIPVDLVTASGSGLDPDISPLAAFYQAPRIAATRNLDEADIRQLMVENIQQRWMGIFGEPRINVLAFNLALDKLGTANGRETPKP